MNLATITNDLNVKQISEIRGCFAKDRATLDGVLNKLGLSSASDKSKALLKAMGIEERDDVFYSGYGDADDNCHDISEDQYEAVVGAFFSGFWTPPVTGDHMDADAWTDSTGSFKIKELEAMRFAAEFFFQRLTTVIPESGIIEHRLGWDTSTGNPTTLTIIPRKYEIKLSDIEDLAANSELDMLKQFNYNCSFWVITDESLDRFLINHDFPFTRMKDVYYGVERRL